MMFSSVATKRSMTSVAQKSLRTFSVVATNSAPSAFQDGGLATANTQLFSSPVTAKEAKTAPAISDSEVTGLFQLWNNALATLDADAVAKRYAKTSVLLPIVSDLPRTDYDGIKSYFVDFLQRKPQGVILESNVIQGDCFCMDAGIYEFTVKARYTYIYQYEDGEWKIAHHHSSVMPESFL